MKKLIYIITLLFIGCLNSDTLLKQEFDTQYDCDYTTCVTQEPSVGYLEIKFTRNFEQPNPQIYLLSGYWDEQSFIDTFKTDTVPTYRDIMYVLVPLDHYYTVACKYIRNSDTIYAIDGTFITKKSYILCDSICWEITDNSINVKLKNF